MKVDALKRRVSSKWKEEPEPSPEPPPKKRRVTKVHARSATGTPKNPQHLQVQTSEQSSPVPFPRSGKASPLPFQPNHATPVEAKSLRSVAESGVLTASLARSRTKWLNEGIFERYWIKSTGYKKKHAPEIPTDNPLTSTMTKIGSCQMIAEPHVFDVTLYTIKEPMTVQTPTQLKTWAYGPHALPISSMPRPLQNKPGQYPNSHEAMRYAAQQFGGPGTQTSMHAGNAQTVQSLQQSQQAQASPTQPPTQMPKPYVKLQQSQPPSSTQLVQPSSNQLAPLQPPLASGRQPSTPAPATKPAQDPVIQMLAQRASQDPNLKVLMKIVASGGATKSQLAVFQGHIDDLTRILTEQKQKQPSKATDTWQSLPTPSSSSQSPAPPAVHSQQPRTNSPNRSYQQHHALTPNKANTGPILAPQNSPYQPPYRTPKAPSPSRSQPNIRGIAMEFTSPGTTGDRYYFPRNAILEFQPYGRLVTASFLVVRKGDDSRRGFSSKESYHQSLTITLCCANPKTLEPLSRAVAPPEQVQEYMRVTMKSTKRAPCNQLALRLPVSGERDVAFTEKGPTTPAQADRRGSLMQPPQTRGSPAIGSHSKKKATTDEALCQYCFDVVTNHADALGYMEAGLMCKACQTLQMKEAASGKTALVAQSRRDKVVASSATRRPTSSGPRVLMFARNIFNGLQALAS